MTFIFVTYCCVSEKTSSDGFSLAEGSNNKGKVPESNLGESDFQGKIGPEKNGPRTELSPLTLEEDGAVQVKTKTATGKSRQTQSGPLTPGIVISHSMSEKGRFFERLSSKFITCFICPCMLQLFEILLGEMVFKLMQIEMNFSLSCLISK